MTLLKSIDKIIDALHINVSKFFFTYIYLYINTYYPKDNTLTFIARFFQIFKRLKEDECIY